ncbi:MULTISPECIES: nuclear transport factor 2 family protein [unclassified Chryseobacterium]|uniref:nuclear transport factor 2 family protein n=1 Tax=unclassified Chryseobacterium TaxID=2593645 RepID=UPI0028536716|nr:nuclear transport factor 2 family protein [Chryseobacterium sp. CFS7]MDR4894371.1 nuclear transport factor 2 family protein [Chryseobacterium sp. CFS7]
MKLSLIIAWLFSFPLSGHAQNVKDMKTYPTPETEIRNVIENYYFKGIYEGNTELLKKAFYKGALLFGDVDGVPYFKTAEQYIEGVGNRVSPQKSGKDFKAIILSIEVINSIAVAKLQVRMYDFNYYNFITFNYINEKWFIINKTLTNVHL